jgi:putative effector of murein hydrolase
MADLLAAAAINGVAPWAVARVVAAGLIGLGALKGGLAASLLGLTLQVAMTLAIGFAWWSMAPSFAMRVSDRSVLGVALGLVVFAVMNFVVVPLSAIGHFPKFHSVPFLLAHLAAMLVYGLAISFLTLRRA